MWIKLHTEGEESFVDFDRKLIIRKIDTGVRIDTFEGYINYFNESPEEIIAMLQDKPSVELVEAVRKIIKDIHDWGKLLSELYEGPEKQWAVNIIPDCEKLEALLEKIK